MITSLNYPYKHSTTDAEINGIKITVFMVLAFKSPVFAIVLHRYIRF